jgi:hypothetical protein
MEEDIVENCKIESVRHNSTDFYKRGEGIAIENYIPRNKINIFRRHLNERLIHSTIHTDLLRYSY